MATNAVEVLFVDSSNLDNKGKRILVRDRGVENILWRGDDLKDVSIDLLGITAKDLSHIERFFNKSA